MLPVDQRHDDKRRDHQDQQDGRTAGVADAERPGAIIGQRGPDCGRRDDRQPVEERVKFLRLDLHEHRGNENDAEDCRADKIAGALGFGGSFAQPRHGDGVAAGLAQRGRQDLDDPEEQRYLWNLGNELRFLLSILSFPCPAVNLPAFDDTTGALFGRKEIDMAQERKWGKMGGSRGKTRRGRVKRASRTPPRVVKWKATGRQMSVTCVNCGAHQYVGPD